MVTAKALLNLDNIRHIHFIGVGGIGMSGLAQMMMEEGVSTSGSDLKASPLTERLEGLGLQFHLGHSASNIERADLVVYTTAVRDDNPELLRAQDLGIPMMSRAQFLGELMARYPGSVGVAGTHGKTTTTAMVSSILQGAGLDPTVLIGADYSTIGGNAKRGEGQYFVAEACEYKEAFLEFRPLVGIILNVDNDHLDYFKDFDNVVEAYRRFAARVQPDGCLVVNADDPGAVRAAQGVEAEVITYGIHQPGNWIATDLEVGEEGLPKYMVLKDGEVFTSVELGIPGEHNVSNSLAAIAAASCFGVGPKDVRGALQRFSNTERRFELKGSYNGARIYDDYAHHPAEIRATLKAARQQRPGRLVVVFQPHLFSRTRDLMQGFADSLRLADRVYVADIYGAREANTGEVSSKDLVAAINNGSDAGTTKALYVGSLGKIVATLQGDVGPGDLVLTMGAGDVDQVADDLVVLAK